MTTLCLRPVPGLTVSAVGLSILLAACSRPPDTGIPPPVAVASAPAPAVAASAPPVGVTTVLASRRDMPVQITATGMATPLSNVEVRPQTTSLVARVHVKEGQFVTAGQLLFTLDARADESNVARARAQLARDEAALADARRQLARSQELLAQNFISQGALDTNQTNVQAQTAAVAADKAALDAARLGLSYVRVTAPSGGRLGAINVFPGSSVQANQTLLASITQLDPIAVAFSLPQRYLPDALAALKDGGTAVTATPPDGAGVSLPAESLLGRLTFVDNAVDAASGTVKVKARFDNSDDRLWPGTFVNVVMTVRVLRGAVVIPQATIVQTASGAMVYVVQADKAAIRPVQVLYAQGADAAVTGVSVGERIVLDGRQNLRPGAAVVERMPGAAAGRPPAGASRAASGKGPRP